MALARAAKRSSGRALRKNWACPADSGTQPAGQGPRRAVLRHGTGPLGQGTASGRGENLRGRQRGARCVCCRAHNRRFSEGGEAGSVDAHRPLGPGPRPGGDSVDSGGAGGGQRLHGAVPQPPATRLLPPAHGRTATQRRGRGRKERLDGSHGDPLPGSVYLKYREVTCGGLPLGAEPPVPRSLTHPTADASEAQAGRPDRREVRPSPTGVQPAGGRSGRTPAEPYPPDGGAKDDPKPRRRPAEDHPWRKPFKPQK